MILNTFRNALKVLGAVSLFAAAPSFAQQTPPVKPAVAPVPAASYAWQVGSAYQYKMTGFFNGHIPPFAQPGSPPIHLRVELTYSATVKKQTDKGVEVAFTVTDAALYLLEKEPDASGKLPKGAEEALFPIPIEQVQEALNATATLAPNGSVISVAGGDSNSVKVNFGFELRKLFLLMLPIAFEEKGGSISKDWTFDDGLLGKNPGKTLYKVHTGDYTSLTSAAFQLTASSDVDEKIDKNDKPAKDMTDTVRTVTGKASLTGNILFAGKKAGNGFAGRVSVANLLLKIDVLQKQLKPDPSKPEEPAEQQIDVSARLKIEELKSAAKLAPKPAPKADNKKAP